MQTNATPTANASTRVEKALRDATRACQAKGLRLTPLRQQVLSIIWETNRPIGAYQIMRELEHISNRSQVAPPTVYRTLDFLLELGFVRRIHSVNAFIGRSSINGDDCPALFICNQCGSAAEVPKSVFQQTINLAANELKFRVEQQAVEIAGQCHQCRISSRTHDS